MPKVDLSQVTDYESFERAYDALIEILANAITDDHKWLHEGKLYDSLWFADGARYIGREPRSIDSYKTVEFVDGNTVKMTWAERGQPAAWGARYTVEEAMGRAIGPAIFESARQYAENKQGDNDFEDREIVRLYRLLDDTWADRYIMKYAKHLA